jgi:hypothetical protein
MAIIRQKTQDFMQAATMALDHRIDSLIAKVGRFLWHLAQMVLVMEVGMMVYHMLLWPLLAPTGYTTLIKAYPLFSYWMMVVAMTLPMVALMRFHKSTWRHCAEMTLAMLAPLAALTVLVLCSLCPIHILYGVGDPVMILAMAAYMLYRHHDHAHGVHQHTTHESLEPTVG